MHAGDKPAVRRTAMYRCNCDCDGYRPDTLGGEIGYFLALAPDVTNSTECPGAFMAVHRVDIEANYAASCILLETDPIDRSIFLV